MSLTTPITGDFTHGPKLPRWLTRLLHHRWRFYIVTGVLVIAGGLAVLGFKMPWKSDRVTDKPESGSITWQDLIETRGRNTADDERPGQPRDNKKNEPAGQNGGTEGPGGVDAGENTSDGGTGNGGSLGGGSPDPGGSDGGSGSGLMMPAAATVGVRYAPTRTITGAQALAELRSTGRLSRTIVTGGFTLEGSDGIGWVIEDVRFQGGNYVVRGYTGSGGIDVFTGTPAQRPVFRYVDLVGNAALGAGSCSAVVYGKDMVFEHADIYGCSDGIKASTRLEFRYSWVHDLDHPSGAHADAVQIVSGTDIVFVGNRFDAYIGYSSDGSGGTGGTASAVLQTGSVTGNISAVWTNNWFAGGHYTIRGSTDPRVAYTFTKNRFLRHGTSVVLGRTDLPPNRYGPTYGGVTDEAWSDNVWDDTGDPIL